MQNHSYKQTGTRLLIFLPFIFISLPGFSQSKTVTHINQEWFQYGLQAKLSDHWTLHGEGTYRWVNNFDHRYQYQLRGSMNYQSVSGINLGAGLVWGGYYTGEHISRNEIRPYQEFVSRQKINQVSIQHRIRVEERFFRDVRNNEISGKDSFNFRFRYRLYFTFPLFHLEGESTDKDIQLSLGDEIFLSAGKEIVTNIFSQNRLYFSPAIPINSHLTLNLTYAYQYASTSTSGKFVTTDIFWIGVMHRVNWYKNGKS